MTDAEIYREEILEHYQHPQNYGALKNAKFSARKVNPLCGDEIALYFEPDRSGKIKNIRFKASGCALSIASASMFTEWLKGKKISRLQSVKPEAALKNFPVPISPARRKCALLIFDALQNILAQKNESKKSERHS